MRHERSRPLAPPMDVEALKIDRSTPPRRSSGRRSRWLGPVVVLLLLAAAFFVFQRQILGFVDSMRLTEVRVQKVVRRSAAQAATATGTSSNGYIVARTRAALSADTPGRIVEMNVEEGSVVKKGDVVARLYADEYAAALRRAEAELALAEAGRAHAAADVAVSEQEVEQSRSAARAAEVAIAEAQASQALAQNELERATKLQTSGVGNQERLDHAQNGLVAARAKLESMQAQSATAKEVVDAASSRVDAMKSAVQEAEARVASAKAARELAKATLEKTEVRAPFDGVVVLKDAEVGEVVSPNVQGGSNARGSVVTMVDFATLEVQAEVPETNITNVKVGAPAQIFLDAYPDKPYRGRVDRVWPTANRSKATVEVRVAFETRDERLRPEMGVRVVFTTGELSPAKETPAASVIVVPSSAIVRRDGAQGVFVVEGDLVHFRPVKTAAPGESQSDRVVVEQGLVEGETFVVDPPPSLAEGERVRRAQ